VRTSSSASWPFRRGRHPAPRVQGSGGRLAWVPQSHRRAAHRYLGQEAHRDTAESQAGYYHRDPLVSSAQRCPGELEGWRVGQACGGGVGGPRGGMATTLRSSWNTADTAPQIPRISQAGDLREKVGGSSPVGRRSGHQQEVQATEQQRLDGKVTGNSKNLASRFYQLKTGHYFTWLYLNLTKSRPTAQCW